MQNNNKGQLTLKEDSPLLSFSVLRKHCGSEAGFDNQGSKPEVLSLGHSMGPPSLPRDGGGAEWGTSWGVTGLVTGMIGVGQGARQVPTCGSSRTLQGSQGVLGLGLTLPTVVSH